MGAEHWVHTVGEKIRGLQYQYATVPVCALSAVTAPQQCARMCWRLTSPSWWMVHPASEETTSVLSAPSWLSWWGPLCRRWVRRQCALPWHSTVMTHGEPKGGGTWGACGMWQGWEVTVCPCTPQGGVPILPAH